MDLYLKAYRGLEAFAYDLATTEEEKRAEVRAYLDWIWQWGKRSIFLLELEGRPVGWGAVRMQRRRRETGEIIEILILPEFRGQGHGRWFLRALEHELETRGARRIVLWVANENTRARRFYERQGYRPTGRLWNIWQEMEKPLRLPSARLNGGAAAGPPPDAGAPRVGRAPACRGPAREGPRPR